MRAPGSRSKQHGQGVRAAADTTRSRDHRSWVRRMEGVVRKTMKSDAPLSILAAVQSHVGTQWHHLDSTLTGIGKWCNHLCAVKPGIAAQPEGTPQIHKDAWDPNVHSSKMHNSQKKWEQDTQSPEQDVLSSLKGIASRKEWDTASSRHTEWSCQ